MEINFLSIVYEGMKDNVQKTYLIQNTISKRFVRLGMNETYYLLKKLNAENRSQELSMDEPQELADNLKQILDQKFEQWGFLDENVKVEMEEHVDKMKKIHLLNFNVEKVLKYVYPVYSKVFTKPFLILFLTLLLGTASYVTYQLAMVVPIQPQDTETAINIAFSFRDIICMLLFLAVNTILHEFAHAVTCIKHGGKVSSMGLMLFYFVPCFYCDVSSVYSFRKRKQRALVASAGILVNIFLGNFVLVIALVLAHFGVMNLTLLYMSVSIISIAFYNLIPFVKLDGYWLLQALTGVDNLMDKSVVLAYLSVFKRSSLQLLHMKRIKRVMLSIYGVISMIFHPAFWAFSLLSLVKVLHLKGQINIIVCGIIGVIILLDFMKTFKYYRKILKNDINRYILTM
ncbi:metalloprotease [[Clostridium] polysaccharolyticum]|uniref:Putative peptide zinc metalloprotease protein n=1 Tax=[Clostridium] polysaccharolyticum TaxID=29364 RepID=A0A1I0DY53_9FIRM|nr:M50 family metallopeptidase [[Clostridium] polysaccharolyticum]SET37635.1 putative peptide zinc metalloprotease protein [[Clostridium] polysaccharolyticum]